MPDLARLRRLFPITERYVYLSHAGSGPLPLPTVKSLAETAETKSLEGDLNYQAAEAVTEKTREMAARLMKVDPAGIAFIKNTSAGAIIAINSIEWHPGDNVILMKDAFPTHTYAFNYMLSNVEKRYDTSADLAEGPDCVYRLCDKHTRCVAIDWVHFYSGIRADISAIGHFCREMNIWFLVDAIQGLGPVDFDFGALEADFVYAGCNKWLLSPHGIGLLYVNPGKLDQLKPANLGWLSAQWKEFNDIYTEKPMKSGASRYEEGTKNYPAIYALGESLRIILEVGSAEIDRHVRRLVDILRKELLAAGFEITTPEEPKRSAGIITCCKPGACNASIHAWLKAANMICSLRQDHLRIAPYFYNTEEEIRRFVARAAEPAALTAKPSDCKT